MGQTNQTALNSASFWKLKVNYVVFDSSMQMNGKVNN